MYQSEVFDLYRDIIQNKPFESCKILNPEYSGIQILGVKKVPNSRGLHCVFVDLENYRGDDYFVLLNGSLRYGFNKPVNEVAAHVDIYGNDNTIRILGKNPSEYSQWIGGLTFNHTNAGHSSYYIYAVKTSDQVEIPASNEAIQTIEQIEELLKKLKGLVK